MMASFSCLVSFSSLISKFEHDQLFRASYATEHYRFCATNGQFSRLLGVTHPHTPLKGLDHHKIEKPQFTLDGGEFLTSCELQLEKYKLKIFF